MDLDHGLNGIENNTREVGPEEAAAVHGPLTHVDSMLQDINEQRTRVLEEIDHHLAEAVTQEDIWYWEAQRDWWYAIPYRQRWSCLFMHHGLVQLCSYEAMKL